VVQQAPEQQSEFCVQATAFPSGRQQLLLEQTWPLPVQVLLQLPQ
jgi:hypothetical protein